MKEQPFIAGLAAAFTLSGLALLYSVVSGEYAGAAELARNNLNRCGFASCIKRAARSYSSPRLYIGRWLGKTRHWQEILVAPRREAPQRNKTRGVASFWLP